MLERVATDLSARAGADVGVVFGLPPMAEAPEGESLDGLDVEIDHYGPPRAEFLAADPEVQVEETLSSELLKSNCPVTGQPDWATVAIRYRGPRIDRVELLRPTLQKAAAEARQLELSKAQALQLFKTILEEAP